MSDLQPVTTVLAQRTIYETPAVLNPSQGVVSALINFPTLNEDLVIQRIIQDHQAKKAQENSLWRIGGGLLGLCLGLGDGFQVGDLIGAAVGSGLGGGISNELQRADEATLRALNLEWVNSPDSYIYHRKRHRGEAVRRLLLIMPHPQTSAPTTTFAVQFPDGYVACLAIANVANQLMFTMAGYGFDLDWVDQKQNLGFIPTDLGNSLPVELWSGQGQHLVAIPYSTPHQFIY
jgi:hypothetical protein